MPRRKRPPIERFTLVAAIQSIERSYYIAEEPGLNRVDDEAILTLQGVIQSIASRHKRHQGKSIEMVLLCARSFPRDQGRPAADKPFLMQVGLRGEERSLGAYLPADAFWALPTMIASGCVTHVEADYSPSRSGYAELLSLHFRRNLKYDFFEMHFSTFDGGRLQRGGRDEIASPPLGPI
jgi:hypothetical protein